jgi:hypothetical protein
MNGEGERCLGGGRRCQRTRLGSILGSGDGERVDGRVGKSCFLGSGDGERVDGRIGKSCFLGSGERVDGGIGKRAIFIPIGFGKDVNKGVNKSSDELLELLELLISGTLDDKVLILVEGKLEEEEPLILADDNFFANNILFPALPSIKTHFLLSEFQIKSDGRFLVPRDANSFNFLSNNISFPTLPSINTQSLVLFSKIVPFGHFLLRGDLLEGDCFNFLSNNIRFPTRPSINTQFCVFGFFIMPFGHLLLLRGDLLEGDRFNFLSNNIRFPTRPSINTQF